MVGSLHQWRPYADGTRSRRVGKASRGTRAGEIVLTSMDADGTKKGYDLPMTEAVSRAVNIPVVASGGAGHPDHLLQAFRVGADAALAASIFHYDEFSIPVQRNISRNGAYRSGYFACSRIRSNSGVLTKIPNLRIAERCSFGETTMSELVADAPIEAVPVIIDEKLPPPREPEVNKLFRMVMKYEASDLHLKVGQPPMMRLRGDIRRVHMPPLTQEDMERLLLPITEPPPSQDSRRGRRRRLRLDRRQRRMPLPRQLCSSSAADCRSSPAASTPRFRTSRTWACPRASKSCAISPKAW